MKKQNVQGGAKPETKLCGDNQKIVIRKIPTVNSPNLLSSMQAQTLAGIQHHRTPMRKKAVGKINVYTRRQMLNIGCKKDEFFVYGKPLFASMCPNLV